MTASQRPTRNVGLPGIHGARPSGPAGVVLLSVALAIGLGLLAGAAGRSPVTHTVTMDGTAFEPRELTVRAGDTVVWVNKDPFPHTATAKDGAFDSKSIDVGKSWTYRTEKKGEFPYLCAFHPTMTGTLRVE